MSMFPIASTTLGSATYRNVFSNISQTFTHLQLRIFGKWDSTSSGNDLMFLQVGNNTYDTGANYAYHRLSGDGSSASSAGVANASGAYGPYFPNSYSGYANMYGCAIIDILDYANINKNKTIRFLGGYDVNGAGTTGLFSAFWNNSATAINQINVSGNSYNWAAGTRFDLYGINSSPTTGA
jgi:hypothetical protein